MAGAKYGSALAVLNTLALGFSPEIQRVTTYTFGSPSILDGAAVSLMDELRGEPFVTMKMRRFEESRQEFVAAPSSRVVAVSVADEMVRKLLCVGVVSGEVETMYVCMCVCDVQDLLPFLGQRNHHVPLTVVSANDMNVSGIIGPCKDFLPSMENFAYKHVHCLVEAWPLMTRTYQQQMTAYNIRGRKVCVCDGRERLWCPVCCVFNVILCMYAFPGEGSFVPSHMLCNGGARRREGGKDCECKVGLDRRRHRNVGNHVV